MQKLSHHLTELDKLKSIYRRSVISDLSRHENSAEHSWHLAVARRKNIEIIIAS